MYYLCLKIEYIMKTSAVSLLVLLLSAISLASCSEKKKSTDIIAPKPVIVAPAAPQEIQGFSHVEKIEWLGQEYKVSIRRTVDKEAPVFKDDTGKKYYENRITLVIQRPDGTEFLKREFTKHSFAQIVGDEYAAKSTVLGLAVLDATGDKLSLLASVGNPDDLSDDYIPIKVTISRNGDIQMAQSDDLE